MATSENSLATESVLAPAKAKSASSALRLGLIALAAALFLMAVYAHVSIARAGDDYAGRLMMFDRLFDLLLASALAAAAFTMGRSICRRFSMEFVSLAEEASFSVLLGAGAMGTALFGLGVVGLLKPLPVVALFVGLGALTRRELFTLRTLLVDTARKATATRARQAASVLFLALLGLLVVRTLAPPHAYDEAIYQLSVTEQFVEQGRIFPVYDNQLGNLPFLLQMIYAVCLMAKADIAAKLFSLLLALTCAVAVYGFCARFLTRRVGMIALFGFLGAGMVIEVAVTVRIDVSLAAMLMLATHAMMVYLEKGHRGWLYASALLSGFGLGLKHTAAIYVILLGVMYLVESLLRKRESIGVMLKRGLVYTAIVAAVASPWFIKNLIWFHNPIYPFKTGEVAEYGDTGMRFFTRDDDTKLDAHFEAARSEIPKVVSAIEQEMAEIASMRVKHNPLHFWKPFTSSDAFDNSAEPYHDPNRLFVVLPLLLFLPRRRWLLWLLLVSISFYASVITMSSVPRYLLPIYPALTILAAYVLVGLADRFKAHTKLSAALPAIAVAVAISSAALVCVTQMYKMRNLQFVTGELSRHQFMVGSFYYPSINFVNRELPADAKVMMMGAQMCYDLKRDYIADASWYTTEWRRLLVRNSTMEGISEDLKRRGVTHVLFTPSLFFYSVSVGGTVGLGEDRLAQSRPDYYTQLSNLATFELFRRNFLEPVYRDVHGYQVLKVK